MKSRPGDGGAAENKNTTHPGGVPVWSRIRESNPSTSVAALVFFVFVAEIVAEWILENWNMSSRCFTLSFYRYRASDQTIQSYQSAHRWNRCILYSIRILHLSSTTTTLSLLPKSFQFPQGGADLH